MFSYAFPTLTGSRNVDLDFAVSWWRDQGGRWIGEGCWMLRWLYPKFLVGANGRIEGMR